MSLESQLEAQMAPETKKERRDEATDTDIQIYRDETGQPDGRNRQAAEQAGAVLQTEV